MIHCLKSCQVANVCWFRQHLVCDDDDIAIALNAPSPKHQSSKLYLESAFLSLNNSANSTCV
ncbi:hypothetical protein Hanom_Chr08g00758841 [Helianthus anomalus]